MGYVNGLVHSSTNKKLFNYIIADLCAFSSCAIHPPYKNKHFFQFSSNQPAKIILPTVVEQKMTSTLPDSSTPCYQKNESTTWNSTKKSRGFRSYSKVSKINVTRQKHISFKRDFLPDLTMNMKILDSRTSYHKSGWQLSGFCFPFLPSILG